MKRTPMRRTELKRTGPATAKVKPLKPKTCSKVKGGCGEKFTPTRAMQGPCGPICAMAFVAKAKAKNAARVAANARREHQARVMEAKPRRYWLDKAEKAVNRYVRARDYSDGCISCHLPSHWDGQWHASHFRSVGAASAVRFNLWNIHKGCSACNLKKSGNIIEYRPRLVVKIGADRVEWLGTQNQRMDFTPEYLQRLAAVFNKKARRKEKRNSIQV
jgi:hypothetical protein